MATYGSRMSFRSRKVDNKKLLLILRDSDAPDIDSIASQRSSVQIETGVEKEEEEEHHLQIAILASQAAYTGGNVTSKYIPTPDASKIIEDYNTLYPADFKQPSALISYDDIYEDSIGTTYCLDEVDQELLRSVNDPALKKLRETRFEEIMSLLEEAAADGRINIKDEKSTVPIDIQTSLKTLNPKSKSLDCHINFVFKHWLKRRRDKPSGEPIMPRLRIDRSTKAGNDPFLCFKRREMKLQRRTRATDSFYISKLNKLREDMKTCQEIIAVTLKREETLEELIKVQDQVFKLRNSIHKKRVAAQYATPCIIPPNKKQVQKSLSFTDAYLVCS
ncbi:Enhancer of polycomb-like protein 1 [Entomophthora muscae]|uniref:Enhancer of polycomb-like protein 1 n=1 Tax=Entomophthora muscae TaxID=34485 RepID=A0ACC2SRK3_9FUNG|nr:Enhancer of polycomb-like protein 1 [Entomophthora muscae]